MTGARPTKKVRKFTYRPRTLAQVRERRQILGLSDAFYQAHKRNASALLAFLRSELPLKHLEPHRHKLADLIERFVQIKDHGKRGGAVPTAKGDVQASFEYRCRGPLRQIRAQNGGRLPPGAIDRVMEEVVGRMGENDELEGQKIDLEAARRRLLKQH